MSRYVWQQESPYVVVCRRLGELRREPGYVIRSHVLPGTWHGVTGQQPRCIATGSMDVCKRAVEARLSAAE